MLLPCPWLCFRTWRPNRGPVRTLLKDERSGEFVWLTGGQAALWGHLEQGTTFARLRRVAVPLGLDETLPELIRHWLHAGWVQNLTDRSSGRAPETSETLQLRVAQGLAVESGPDLDSGMAGKRTTEVAARAWLTAQGYPFEADWNLAELNPLARQAMDRLDFLRESGVFQIRFLNWQLQTSVTQHIRLAAKAQGFSVVLN